MLDCVIIISDVLTNVNLDKILKSDLVFKKLNYIKSFLDYLDCLCKDMFMIIKQFGPSMFFGMFIIGVNNWPIFVKIVQELYHQHIDENLGIKKVDYNIKELVRNYIVNCAYNE